MPELSKLLWPFAVAIHAKSEAIREMELASKVKARILESISDDIKKCSNFVMPDVSVGALIEAASIEIDLTQMNWHDQPLFDKGRRIFHFEHLVPVSSIRDSALAQRSAEDVLDILMNRIRVVWILKSEDAELTRLGYRSRRENPEAAYRAAGIDIAAHQNAPADAPKTARR